jgi:ABC-2 type transport system ATP-binding protein
MTTNGNDIAVRCQGLTRRYGQVEALVDLDLAVPAGSVFGFLGRNGAGKTTTIRLLTGLAKPTAGSAWVAGVETTNDDNQARERFGYLPEEPAFYTWMTPQEFLDYIGRLFGLPAADRRKRTAELLALAGLQDAARRRIGGFSRGMRQRLGLAQALVHRPPVLLLDEPTSALDPAGRRDVLDLIDSLRGQTTIFLSSHILADVERVCDTIGVIHQGRLLTVAGRQELLDRHAADTALLVFSPDQPAAADLAGRLRELSWVNGAELTGDELRVSVHDVAAARRELLALVVGQGLALERYEWLRPTLEDVFLSLSS